MNIVELFLNAAGQFPNNTAIIDKGRHISYAQLKKEVEHTAAYLRQKGIGRGDRVLVFVPMSIPLYRLVLAIFYVGATAVFLDEWVSWKRLQLCCRLAQCKGFVGVPKARVLAIFSGELRKIPVKFSASKMANNYVEPEPVHSDEPALITFTTGSTGTPKAALRSHGFLHEQFKALLSEINPSPTDVDMTLLPIVLFMNLGVGSTSVIAPFNQKKPAKNRFDKIVELIQGNQICRITASPFFSLKLADYCSEHLISLDSLAKLFTGGAPVFPQEAAKLTQAFPNTWVHIAYGSTEAEPISTISAKDLAAQNLLEKGGLPVGEINAAIHLRIIPYRNQPIEAAEETLEAISLDEGAIGEIVVSGPHVLASYFNNEDAFKRNKIVTQSRIWHRTGDSGFVKDSHLYLAGPCKELIWKDDECLSPFLAEQELKSIPGISVGTVLKVADKIVVAIETTTGRVPANLNFSFHFNELRVLKALPRDPRHFSKIDYGRLREMLIS